MTGPRRRKPDPLIRPEEIRLATRDVREGLDWVGKVPATRASIAYRVARGTTRAVLMGLFGFRVDVQGRENVPADGGYMTLVAIHRGWIDPFLAVGALPVEPRVWTQGSSPTVFNRRWKVGLFRIVGGVLPVWRGGVGFEVHVTAARAVLERGGVFAAFVEGGMAGLPDRPAPFRLGSFVIALRTGAPIVPFAMAGTEVLYRGKHFTTRIMPLVTIADLVGAGWNGPPEPGSREELVVARIAAEELEKRMAPVITEIRAAIVDPPYEQRRWPWLTTLL